MLTSIYLQRRRLLFGMFFFFLSGLLDFGRFGMWAFPINVVLLSTLFALICGLIAAVLIPIFPAYRNVFELLSVVFFVQRFIEAMGWAGDFGKLFDTSWGAILFAAFFTLLYHFIYGDWWARTPFRLSWTGQTKFQTTVTPDDVWRRAVPSTQHPEDYYSGTLHEFRPVEDADHSHLLRLRLGGPQFLEQRVTVTAEDVGRRFAYDFTADVSDKNRDLNSGHWRIDVTPDDEGCLVEAIETVTSTTPGHALLFWFDDLGGQVAVSMKRVLEGRKDPTILGWLRRKVTAAA